ncbi:spatacsin-like [Glandiceps talaboti]
MLNDMTHCTPYVKDKILDEMARRGLFTSEELEDFNKLLHRLSRSTSLFVQPHVLDDSYMMNMEEFHDHFIKYCIQNYLPNVLYFYLDFYKLAVCDQELQAVASIDRDSSWFEMLLFFRYTGLKYNDPSVMFQASLANIRFILKVTQPTVTCLLEANKPIAAMATLIYAPGTLYEVTLATENEEERLWKVDPELLKQSLQTYSKLQSALFPIQTADGVTPQDITMYQLLKGNTSFDPSKLFRWQSTNNLATQGSDDFMEIPHFSRPDLANKYGHKEILRYTYYLRQGRPSFAFLTFIKSLGDGDSALVRKRIKQAYIKSYMIAVRNFKTTSISAACVVFVEMLGQDSLVMRVAIQASNIIFTHERQFVMMDQYTDKNNKEKKVKDVEEDIISDFLSILRHRRTSAEKILRHLEDAISANVKKSDEESTSFEANQQWSLAILFCHLHKLAYSSVFLEECARADQWLRFLCFAQNYQYPQQQVLELIRQFHSPNLRDHLHHAVENLQYTGSGKAAEPKDTKQAKRSQDLRMQYLKRVGISKGAVGSSTDSDKEGESHGKMEESTVTSSDTGMDVPPADIDVGHIPSDLFGVIFVCENTSQPWRHMLAHCVALRRPILAVLAACFTEASMLECLCVWSLMMMDDDCIAMVTHNMASVQWHRWSLEDVSVIIDVAMEKKYYSLLIKAFTVFDPDCALLGFFRFVKSFLVRHDGKACKIHLRQFQDAMLQLELRLVWWWNSEMLPKISQIIKDHVMLKRDLYLKQRS